MKKIKSLSDEELIELVRNKDQELYKEVVRRYQTKLMRYATGLIQDEDKAADVVQESFIKAFVNLRGFNTKKKFSSWIYRIVHNEAINYIKKHKKEISLENNKWVERAAKSNEDVEEDFNQKEAKEMLYLSLKELPLKYRSPLVLFFLEEKTYEEISDVLRIPIGTVGTRINRGKKMLRLIYKKKGGEVYAKN
ncbi:hypothetical protein AMJ51_00545 [Microgenomates bacterium DG_75]|nr:MAG: hypothetical protein AMJ51_00545 [Microgenomates bacterium DG_75]